jgi:hypothetical protein
MSISLNNNRAPLRGRSTQEAVMGQTVPRQHPAVVLRSHYRQLRALLVIALVAIVGASATLVIVANDEESTSTTAKPVPSIEYGSFNPQTGRPMANVATPEVAKPIQPIEYGNFNPQTGRPMANGATPDESKIAAAISSTRQSGAGGLDESRVAAAIGTSTASPTGGSPVTQAHPGARP